MPPPLDGEELYPAPIGQLESDATGACPLLDESVHLGHFHQYEQIPHELLRINGEILKIHMK